MDCLGASTVKLEQIYQHLKLGAVLIVAAVTLVHVDGCGVMVVVVAALNGY